MRRGFKAEAERHAAHLREAVGCGEYETMNLPALARHLKVAVLAADRVLGSAVPLQRLHEEQRGAWSAGTILLPDGRTVVVYNPIVYDTGDLLTPQQAQHDGRTRSDVGHELAHIVLGHQVRQVQRIGEHSFFTCDPEQEKEATWLAGALLLPRSLLLQAVRRGEPEADIATRHEVTSKMVTFRLNTTGVRMQAARGRGGTRQRPSA